MDAHLDHSSSELSLAGLLRGDNSDPRCEVEIVCPDCTDEAPEADKPVTHTCPSRARWVTIVPCVECGNREPMIACDDHYDMIREALAECPAEIVGVSRTSEWHAL